MLYFFNEENEYILMNSIYLLLMNSLKEYKQIS